MASNNKSFGTIILVVLLFLAVAAGSWFFFSKKKTDTALDSQTAAIEESVDENAVQDEAHDQAAVDLGKAGKIFDKPVNPLLGVRAMGNPNAPIKVREFFSLTCNHCADFHMNVFPALKSNYIDTGKVYFIFEEFPLNGPALYASMIARCLPEDRYPAFIDVLFKDQEKWAFSGDFKGSLKQHASLAGMGDEDFEICFNDQELQKALGENIKLATDNWTISSTPSFVFNNGERIVNGVQSIETMDKIIAELSGSVPAAGAPAAPAFGGGSMPSMAPAPTPTAPAAPSPAPAPSMDKPVASPAEESPAVPAEEPVGEPQAESDPAAPAAEPVPAQDPTGVPGRIAPPVRMAPPARMVPPTPPAPAINIPVPGAEPAPAEGN